MTVTAEDGTTIQPYTVTVTRAGAGITVTIEAEHESIGGGVEDLKFTLTRTGATTDALTVTVTLTQDQNWLTSTYLTHEVEFAAGEATKELIIEDDDFSFDPTTSGNLVATVTGTGVAGGTDTVVVISIADPPITLAFDQDAYSFPEGGPADDVEIYVTATLDAAFTRKPSSNFYVAIATEEGTATGPEDYVFVSRTPSFKPTDFTANSVGQQVASLLFGPSTGNRRLVIVDDDVYEVDETFNVQIEFTASVRFGLVRVKKADGTFCVLSTSCGEIPYPVTITDDDLPTLSLAAAPTSIAEEDNSTTTVTVENVSTVTVEITNGKTFAEDQTVTLTFSGDATQGTHYSVSPGDTDTNATGHQVVLVKETASVEVTVTATGNDTDDGNRTVTVAADLEGTAIGSTDITILDDDTTTPNTPPTVATAIPDQSATVGTAFSYAFPATTFTDAESDPLTYTATKADGTPLPAWLSFNESTRAFSGTPPAAGTVSVKVTASDGAGSVSDTFDITVQPVPTTVPGYPTGLTATADGTSTIDLDWDAPSDDGGAAITGYRIEVSPNGTSSSWSDLVANTNSTSTSYSHTGLSAGTTRHYRVSAINSVGTGAASRTANATTTTVPGYPTGLSATADGTSTIDLDWTAPSDDGGAAITGYRIEVSPNGTSSSWSDLVANTNSTSTSYSHTGLSAGTTRHYRVSAINSVGTGAASRTANATTDDAATTVPDAPTGLSATADGTSTIDLDWTAPSDDGGASITGYRIEVSPNGTSSSWSDLVANTNSTSTSYSHTGLSAGTTRHYRVSAINSVGTGAASRTANATTDDAATTVPDAPTGLSATADGTSTIDLDWTAPADNGGASITGYRIEVSSNGGTQLDQPRRQHHQHQHHLRPHWAGPRHHPPLPRLRHQRHRHRRRLQHRQRHHRRGRPHRARRPDRPLGNGRRDQHDRPRLDRAGRQRRHLHHRLQDRGLLQRRNQLDQPRRQHHQHQHHLRPHWAGPRHHPPLPRLRHQRHRHRRRLQHRQRHHRRGRRAGAGGGDRARAGAIGVGGGHRPFRAAAQRRRHGLAQGQLPARRVVRRQLREVVGLLQAGRHAERGGLRRRAVARHGDGARHGAFASAVHRGQRSE